MTKVKVRNLTVETSRKIRADFSALQWQLYRKHDAYAAALTLNRKLEECVNAGMSRTDTRLAMDMLMVELRHMGASDSEPRQFLEDALEEIYEGGAK